MSVPSVRGLLFGSAAALLAALGVSVHAGAAAVSQSAPARAASIDAAALYKKHCVICHGAKGDSKLPGMSFVDGQWKQGTTVKEMSAVIKDGVSGTAMLPFKSKLNDAEVEALAKYVRAFDPALKNE